MYNMYMDVGVYICIWKPIYNAEKNVRKCTIMASIYTRLPLALWYRAMQYHYTSINYMILVILLYMYIQIELPECTLYNHVTSTHTCTRRCSSFVRLFSMSGSRRIAAGPALWWSILCCSTRLNSSEKD